MPDQCFAQAALGPAAQALPGAGGLCIEQGENTALRWGFP